MGIKKYKPETPGFRHRSVVTYEELTTDKPYKPLLTFIKNKAGRNNHGRITVRRRGGGNKRRYRIIDFKRSHSEGDARVLSIEYDPNRSAFISLIQNSNGRKSYIVAPRGIKVGDVIKAKSTDEIVTGNALLLKDIPSGTMIHNIELIPSQGAKIVRGAGCQAQVLAKSDGMVLVKLPSGEQRYFNEKCLATVGQVSNADHSNVSLGKAGASRWVRKRSKVRGVAMNPVDHPHGGGEGKTSGGRHPVSYSHVPAKGYRTRKKKKKSNLFIVRRRYDK